MKKALLTYNLAPEVEAFTAGRDTALPCPVIQGHQVHDKKVAIINRPGLTREDLEGYDAFITNLKEVAIGVRTADCVPVLLYDPATKTIAAVHAGWKGTVLNIVQEAIGVMKDCFSTNPKDLMAVIGPAIGPDSFQVGEEVVEQFRAAGFDMDGIWQQMGPGDGTQMSGGHHIDLFKANRILLEKAGLSPANIQIAGIDTYTDTAFYSARREGAACGRNINAIKLL